MLRICYSLKDSVQQWTLCGQLAGLWVDELRACWKHTTKAARSVVDLSDVTFIDESGEKLLQEMRHAGVEFLATGVDTKDLVENLMSQDERTLRRLI